MIKHTPILQIMTTLLRLLAISTLPSSNLAWEKRNDAHGKTIIGYYASWQWYDRSKLASPSNLDHSKVTRYNFAFFQINSKGDIWGTDSWADPTTLYGEQDWSGEETEYCSWDQPGKAPNCVSRKNETGLISQAHEAGVEVYPSIGGWTLSDSFPAMAADPWARQKFADNCVKLIEDYDFDGIDIDWEYPGYVDHNGTPSDTANYSKLLQVIRDALDELGQQTGRFYGLTAALPCGPDLIKNIEIDTVSNILTELNLMTYDFFGGSWSTTTGANSPLYDIKGSPGLSVDGCVANWMEGGGSPNQINIGLPFYGRSFAGTGLTGMGQAFEGTVDMDSWSNDAGNPQYYNLVDNLCQFTPMRDERTKTAYAYNDVGLVTYDNERSICDKTEYAIDNGLNGFVIWEISGDLMPDLSTPLLDAANDRLNHRGFRCDEKDWELNVVGDSKGLWAGVIGDYPEMYDLIDPHNGGTFWEDHPYYPDFRDKSCVNDGKHSEFMAGDYLSDNAWECCDIFYGNDQDTLAKCIDMAGTSVAARMLEIPAPTPPCPTSSGSDNFVTSNYCGSSWGDANSKCTTPCPGGIDEQCPNGEKCFADCNSCVSGEGDGVSSATSNYCGSSWGDANGKCMTPCPGGMDGECPGGEKCFADLDGCVGEAASPAPVPTLGGGVSETSNYCGSSWGDANSKCTTPCPGGMDGECPGGEKCFADCTSCGDESAVAAVAAAAAAPTLGGGTSATSNYCGSSWGDANGKCTTPCPGGMDGECPGGEKCFADCTGCSGGGAAASASTLGVGAIATSNYCGTNWWHANSECKTPCPGGSNGECPVGEQCFTDCNECVGVGGGGAAAAAPTFGGGAIASSNYCGSSWGDANGKCMTPCPGGMDGECPGGEKCFADCTGCSGGGATAAPILVFGGGAIASSNYCGSSWGDANSKCATSCPGGMDRECPSGEKCFADLDGCAGGGGGGGGAVVTAAKAAPTLGVGASASSNYCGSSWGDANGKCAISCPGGMDRECPSGEKCFADLGGCVDGGGGGAGVVKSEVVAALAAAEPSGGAPSNYCGSSWGDANSKCATSCPGGMDRECPSGEKCFADLGGCVSGGRL